MRYSQDHKAQTHQRIIKEASVSFRRDGIGATGLQPLMKALGLTHGGFYAHFKSNAVQPGAAVGRVHRQLPVGLAPELSGSGLPFADHVFRTRAARPS